MQRSSSRTEMPSTSAAFDSEMATSDRERRHSRLNWRDFSLPSGRSFRRARQRIALALARARSWVSIRVYSRGWCANRSVRVTVSA